MAQYPIEIILLRQWAGYLSVPIWITDPDGNLVYFNESAEKMMGVSFDDSGEMPPAELLETFSITDAAGDPIEFHDLPLVIALTTHKPAHRHIRARSADGDPLDLQVTALPVEGEGGRHLGAMVAFWEASE
ncbi:MAG TPA: PAS domain-containing protein [Acidimicrobiia bacterium]